MRALAKDRTLLADEGSDFKDVVQEMGRMLLPPPLFRVLQEDRPEGWGHRVTVVEVAHLSADGANPLEDPFYGPQYSDWWWFFDACEGAYLRICTGPTPESLVCVDGFDTLAQSAQASPVVATPPPAPRGRPPVRSRTR